MSTRFFGIIPARYASTRFPGKPLAMLDGKPIIQHVCEHVAASPLNGYAVATDDERIAQCVRSFGGNVVMTSPSHPSGTDRCGEAARLLGLAEQDVVVNIQAGMVLRGARAMPTPKCAGWRKPPCRSLRSDGARATAVG